MSGDDALPGPGAFRHPRPRLCHVPSPWAGTAAPTALVTSTGRFAPDTSLFHDGAQTDAVALRLDSDRIVLSVDSFGGSYVSLALDLPQPMASDLDPDHDLRVMTTLAAAANRPLPVEGYLRLSVDDGGALWQQTVPLPVRAGAQSVALGPGRDLPDPLPDTARRAWIDLVFTGIAGTAISIQSLTISRGPMPVL